MKQDLILELADLNYAEALREQLRWNSRGEIIERGGWLLSLGANPFPAGLLNAALPLRPEAAADPREHIEEIGHLFAEQGRGFTVHVPSHYPHGLVEACKDIGLQPVVDTPGMLLDARIADPVINDADVELRIVTDAAGARDFAAVSARAYSTMGLPEQVAASIFALPERILQPHMVSVVAYRNSAAVAGAMIILSHGIAGVYWVGTCQEARGCGLGDACARTVSNLAFDRGAAFVVLQASPQGEPIYRRMGYRQITRYIWYCTLTPLGGQ